MSLETAKASLKQQLAEYGILLVSENEKNLFLESGYRIEVENPNLFKLLHAEQVVAPFDDIKELCEFIQMDKQLNAQ